MGNIFNALWRGALVGLCLAFAGVSQGEEAKKCLPKSFAGLVADGHVLASWPAQRATRPPHERNRAVRHGSAVLYAYAEGSVGTFWVTESNPMHDSSASFPVIVDPDPLDEQAPVYWRDMKKPGCVWKLWVPGQRT